MERREFIKNSGILLAASPFMNFAGTMNGKKMIILGVDGMDPGITHRLMQQGKLPNMQKLAQKGAFTMMRTTIPPQSPVAWGSFATGADPGVYGVFDFVHRNPANYMAFSSQAETTSPGWVVPVGKYNIPLKSSKVTLLREGTPFWDYLEDRDVEATLFKLPGNYPPSKSKQKTISGLGTPGVDGNYGTYILYTNDEEEVEREVYPNKIYYAYINDDNVMEEGVIEGPRNDLLEEPEVIEVPFTVHVDYKHKTARIDVQGKEILISEKEYSEWVEIDFPIIKHLNNITGMVRFYLLNLSEERFRLYVSPVHISPAHPAVTISTPEDYSVKLAEKCGLFHTISLPSDTKALQQGVFDMENFLVQHMSVHNESEKIFGYELNRFLQQKGGLLFFYFSTLDLGQHMLWSLNDKEHPFYQEKEAARYQHVRDELYMRHDRILGDVLKKVPKDVEIVVMSDHGFGPYRRSINLNNWLHSEGYLTVKGGEIFDGMGLLEYADWDSTKAYFLGLNGLYLNMDGREGNGIVKLGERRKLLEEIKGKLEMLTDPANGEKVISTAYISEDNFSKDYIDRAPDIIVGFKKGYRSSNVSALGNFSSSLIYDNMDWWAGDHLIDPKWVPATFISSFKITKKVPEIKDLAPTILKYFGIANAPTISGKSLI